MNANAPSVVFPRVSVVVPLYDKRATIPRALRSILAQTYANLEVLVIDDGSRDGGGDLVRAIASRAPRVTLHRQENAGPGAARNRGLALADGTLVTFLDADDEWDPEFLATAVTRLREHPECAAFVARHRIAAAGATFLSGRRERRARPNEAGPTRLHAGTSRDEIAWCLEHFHACGTVFRTAIARELGGFFAEDRCTYSEDVYFWIQLRMRHAIYRHPAPLACYHQDASELGIAGRKTALPLEPVFTHAETVRRAGPPETQRAFDVWLGRHALRAAFLHVRDGRPDLARHLLATIPAMRHWPVHRQHLRARLAFPALWRLRETLRSHLVPRRELSPS